MKLRSALAVAVVAVTANSCSGGSSSNPEPPGDSPAVIDETPPGDGPAPSDAEPSDPEPSDAEPGDPTAPGDPTPPPGDSVVPPPGDSGTPTAIYSIDPPPRPAHEAGMPWEPPAVPPPDVPPVPPPPMKPVDPGNGTNVPPDPVIVGGPPATCQVYEFAVSIEPSDGKHLPFASTVTYRDNPPASGPNYEMWAEYGRYSQLARPHWVHNLRHGAIVLIYRPDAPGNVVGALAQALDQIPNPASLNLTGDTCPQMGIMTPDPELNHTFAVLAWGWMMTSNCAPKVADIADFAKRHVYRAPEKVCGDGAWPVRSPCWRFEDTPKIEWTREVPEGTAVTYVHNPPASGAYYPVTLKYGRYDREVPAPYWTMLLARGGIVVLYRPDAPQELIDELKREYDELPPHWKCGNSLTAMVQDSTLSTPVAFVGYGQYTSLQCVVGWEMQSFVTSRRFYGPLQGCDDGTFLPEPLPVTPPAH